MRLFSQCVLATLLYSDIFHSPLTLEEIDKRLLFVKEQGKNRQKKLRTVLKSISQLSQEGEYYFLKKGKKSLREIKKIKKYTRQKRQRAEEYSRLLKWIPMITCVGLTGAVAAENSDNNDDIDLLIITKPGLVWTTRFFATLFFDILQIRRHRRDTEYKDKFCLNMFLDNHHLAIPSNCHDIYTAYETIQMKILWEKDDVYESFLDSNKWIGKILPNHWSILQKKYSIRSKEKNEVAWWVRPVEYLFRTIQIAYMDKINKTEDIKDGVILFYPENRRQIILDIFFKKCRQFQLDIHKGRQDIFV